MTENFEPDRKYIENVEKMLGAVIRALHESEGHEDGRCVLAALGLSIARIIRTTDDPLSAFGLFILMLSQAVQIMQDAETKQ